MLDHWAGLLSFVSRPRSPLTYRTPSNEHHNFVIVHYEHFPILREYKISYFSIVLVITLMDVGT